MIAHIIPLLRLGRQCDFFDYTIPESITTDGKVGHLIQMSFRKKKTQGILWSVTEKTDTPQDLKSIESLIKKDPYVSAYQMQFLEWFSSYYHISLPHAASIFIPQQPARSVRKSKDHTVQLPSFLLQSDSRDDAPVGRSLCVANDWKEYFSILKTICAKTITDGKQTLIITPSIHDAQIIHAFLNELFPQNCILVSGDTSKSVLANSYNLLAEEMCHIAISTRMVLGWNIPSLDHIVLIDPESRDYKQYDKNPRYDVRAAAEYITRARNISLTHLSTCPSSEMIERSKHDGTCIISSSTSTTNATLINLSDSLRNGNYSFISDELQDAVKNSLEANKGAFLFLNRKGYGGLVRCNQCSYVFVCTDCKLPQRYSLQQNTLRCTTCQKTEKLSGACTQCSSHNVSFPGIGTEKIAQHAKKIFQDIPIIETHVDAPLSQESKDILSKAIVIGTSNFLQNNWELCGQLGCIGVLVADPLQSLSDFRSIEYQWQTLMHISFAAHTFAIPLMIQSFDPSSVPIQTLSTHDWKLFCDWQLEQRKRFSWPPYSRIIKIIARHHTLQIPNAMQSLMKMLQVAVAPIKDSVTIFRANTMRFEDRPYLLVRINQPSEPIDPLPQVLEALLPQLLDDWLIDIDPVTF